MTCYLKKKHKIVKHGRSTVLVWFQIHHYHQIISLYLVNSNTVQPWFNELNSHDSPKVFFVVSGACKWLYW